MFAFEPPGFRQAVQTLAVLCFGRSRRLVARRLARHLGPRAWRALVMWVFSAALGPPEYKSKEFARVLPPEELLQRWALALQQNTPEWLAARGGKVGASSMAGVCGWDSHVPPGILWLADLGYLSRDEAHSDPFYAAHGHAQEDAALARYEALAREFLAQSGAADAPAFFKLVGLFVARLRPSAHASPDLIAFWRAFGDRGIGCGEIKNPIYSVYVARLPDGMRPNIPVHYMFQMQAQMEIILEQVGRIMDDEIRAAFDPAEPGRLWCDFIARWVANERQPVHKLEPDLVELVMVSRVYHSPEFCRLMWQRHARYVHAVRTRRMPPPSWTREPIDVAFDIRPIAEQRFYRDGRSETSWADGTVHTLAFAELATR